MRARSQARAWAAPLLALLAAALLAVRLSDAAGVAASVELELQAAAEQRVSADASAVALVPTEGGALVAPAKKGLAWRRLRPGCRGPRCRGRHDGALKSSEMHGGLGAWAPGACMLHRWY